MKNKNSIKTICIVVFITIIIKLLGFARELVLAYFYGASIISDAYLLSSDIVSILFGWIVSFSVVFTPIFSTIYTKYGKDGALDYTRKILMIVIVLSFGAICVTEAIPEVIVKVVGGGLSETQRDSVVDFLKIVIFSVGLNALSELFISYLNLNESHITANLVGIPFNIIEIVAIAVAAYLKDPVIMAFGVVGGNTFKCIIAYIASIRKGFRIINLHSHNDLYLRQTWKMFIPVYFTNMLVEINTLVDKSFASYLPEGSLTELNYGAVTRRFIFNVFSIVISSIFFPMFSKRVAQSENKKMGNIIERTINSSIVFFVPVTILAIINSRFIIEFLFSHGALKDGTSQIISIFTLYCIGLTPMIVNDICSKVVYSYKNSRIPLYTGMMTIVFNCLFNYIFIEQIQTPGLALATSLSQFIVTPIFLLLIHRRVCSYRFDVVFMNFLETVLVSGSLYVVYGLLKHAASYYLSISDGVIIFEIVGSIAYVFTYIITMLLFKNKAIIEIFSYLNIRKM